MSSRQTKTDKILEARKIAFKAYPYDTLFTAEFIVRILTDIQKELADVRKRKGR